ncbi:MAG: dTDP-4-dehydrorhamnose reductase [Gemmatales bacterium]|nr:dTDP-4-dehydrorhamnose reductase [Gemmatales bacterium]
MDYLIIGGTGQLGQAFARRLGSQAKAVSRPQFDLTVPGAAEALLRQYCPRIVLNCAAHNHVDQAENEPHQAFATNAFAVRELAQACARAGALLVHFSTDYVFGLAGNRRHPYVESDLPGPLSVYGASKLVGEYFVRAITMQHLVVRTCGLYGLPGTGGKKTNFVEAILNKACRGEELNVVIDQVCSPTYVNDLVEGVLQCLDRGLSGLIHIVNEGEVSWYDFASSVVRLAGLSAKIKPILSCETGARAPRPAYSALQSERADAPRLRPWQSALTEYLELRRPIGRP